MDGNIDCEIIEVTTQSPDLPAKPASCDLDYGTRFFMEREGNPTMPCHGDTVRNPKGSVIPYGGSFALHGITCRQRRNRPHLQQRKTAMASA